MLDKELQEILDLTMKYVNNADKHKVDAVSIEPELQDIKDDIELLAMEIEEGKWEDIDESA